MKKNICIYLFMIGMSFYNNSYGQISSSSDKQIRETLKSFYKVYIAENDKMPIDEKKLNSIKRKYCTLKFIKKMKASDLDYDPFVKAQDYDKNWLKTMKINKDSKKNIYVVCFMDTYVKTNICVKLLVLKVNKEFKIDNVY